MELGRRLRRVAIPGGLLDCLPHAFEEGNVLAEDEQWAKLRMVVELADEVWR